MTDHLAPVGIGAVVVQGCTRCRGLFVPTNDWDAILDLTAHDPLPHEVLFGPVGSAAAAILAARNATDPYREGAMPPPADPPLLPEKVDTGPPVACPVCGGPCDRVEFAGLSRVMVDVCGRHGIWLDAGELALVVARARENPTFLEIDRSADEREARAREMLPREPSLAVLLVRAIVRSVRGR